MKKNKTKKTVSPQQIGGNGEIVHISQLKPDQRNARKHTPHNLGLIVNALQEVGAARSGVIDENGRVLAGNATLEALAQAGIEHVKVVDAKGSEWVVVRRTGLTEKQKQRLALFDNRSAEFAEWDFPVLQELLPDQLLDGLWSEQELGWIKDGWVVDNAKETGPYDPEGERFVLKIIDVAKKHKNKLLKAVNGAIEKTGLAKEYQCEAF